jgi:outer membrane murein-binding lipoprotein Lpp
MITNQTKAQLAAMGARHRAAHLVQQAGYTLGIAALAGTPLAGLLPANFLDEATHVRDDVDKLRQDKTAMAAEAKQATGTQNSAVREIKDWRRSVASRCLRAVHAGLTIPDELTHLGNPRTVPDVLDSLSKTIRLLKENAATLATIGPDVAPLIELGSKLYQALDQADSTQEQTRSAQLPATAIDFNAKKGELYAALKIINEAGHELFCKDPEASARFNLSLLYRRGHQPAAAEPTPPAPPTA